MPDQLRYDCIGAFGNEVIKTPNIDKLANGGTKFTKCFLQNSVCSQSRCSIFTSKYNHVDGHRGLNSLLQPWEPNVFKTLKEEGYHIAMLAPRGDLFGEGAAELSVSEYGFITQPEKQFVVKPASKFALEPQDRSIWESLFFKGSKGEEPVLDYDEAAIRTAEQWLENPPKDKPWVLFLPLIYPHCPFGVEEPYFSMYDRSKIPKPLRVEDKTGYEPQFMEELRKWYGTERADDAIWAEVAANYYGMISRLDDQLGRVLDKLDSTKLNENTYTFFFTDHGEYLGDYGLIEKWPSGVNNSLVHQPLIINGPGIPQNKTVESLCEMVDLGPTLFDLCGVDEHPFPHNGKSLLGLIEAASGKGEGEVDHKDFVFSEGGFLETEERIVEYANFPYDVKSYIQHSQIKLVGRVTAIRDNEFTYVYRVYEPPELYNNKTDPGELHNLAHLPEYAEKVTFYKDALLNWIIRTSDHASFQKDARFPKVNLPTPLEQYESRIADGTPPNEA